MCKETLRRTLLHGTDREFAEITLRCRRRMGEMLQDMPKHLPGPNKKDPSHDGSDLPKLSDLGITYNDSSSCQKKPRRYQDHTNTGNNASELAVLCT